MTKKHLPLESPSKKSARAVCVFVHWKRFSRVPEDMAPLTAVPAEAVGVE